PRPILPLPWVDGAVSARAADPAAESPRAVAPGGVGAVDLPRLHVDRALRAVAEPPEGVLGLAGAAADRSGMVRRDARPRGRELRVHLGAAADRPSNTVVVRCRDRAAHGQRGE